MSRNVLSLSREVLSLSREFPWHMGEKVVCFSLCYYVLLILLLILLLMSPLTLLLGFKESGRSASSRWHPVQ